MCWPSMMRRTRTPASTGQCRRPRPPAETALAWAISLGFVPDVVKRIVPLALRACSIISVNSCLHQALVDSHLLVASLTAQEPLQ